MEYLAHAVSKPVKGQDKFGPRQVVPNQSLSLAEILARFTRGEAVAIGRATEYHESEDDLEKISHMDLVDKQEYVEKWKETQKQYQKQEKKRKQDLEDEIRKKIEDEEREKLKRATLEPKAN